MPVVVLGTLALAGFVTVRRALDSTTDADVEPALDIREIQSAVEENGLRAITEIETLESAINDDELESEIDIQRLQTAVEEQLAGVGSDIESLIDSEELDAATDRGLSAITEQEVIDGTIDRDEVGVSVDVDELRSVLESGAGTLERTTDAISEKLTGSEMSGSLLGEESMDGTRIAVVDEQGKLESLADEPETVDTHSQSIDIDGEDNEDTNRTGE